MELKVYELARLVNKLKEKRELDKRRIDILSERITDLNYRLEKCEE